MQKLLRTFIFLVLSFVISLHSLPVNALGEPAPDKIIITEIKLGGGGEPKEFVELFNPNPFDITLEGWALEYAKPSFDRVYCDSLSWTDPLIGQGSNSKKLSLPALMSANEVHVIEGSGSSLTDSLGGSLRLIDSSGSVQDFVGWDNNNSQAPCLDDQIARQPAAWPETDSSLQRYIDCSTNLPIDTDDNSADFVLKDTPMPGDLSGPLTSNCTTDPPPPDDSGDSDNTDGDQAGAGGKGSGPSTSCDGLIVNELLVNPAGSDTGHEFIELYNPTEDFIPLTGCKLQTSSSSKIYEFSEGQMDPGKFQAFYNDVTGLSLTNSGGGSVYLIDTDASEIYQADYPPDLADDLSWSLINGAWRQTYAVTPDAANKLLEDKPCSSGQVRNPESGRCINVIEEAAGLAPCPAGKERNPATNRCRNIASLASMLTACAIGQVRNPATNRCKKTDNSSSALVPCKPGQERNPQTHRCRKSSTSSSRALKDVKDVLSDTTNTGSNNWFASGLAISGALLYAFWEWRNEIFEKLGILKTKLGKISP